MVPNIVSQMEITISKICNKQFKSAYAFIGIRLSRENSIEKVKQRFFFCSTSQIWNKKPFVLITFSMSAYWYLAGYCIINSHRD